MFPTNLFKPNPRKVLKMSGDAQSSDFRCPALVSLRDLDNELSRVSVRASELSRASGDAIELRGTPVTHQDKVVFFASLRLCVLVVHFFSIPPRNLGEVAQSPLLMLICP